MNTPPEECELTDFIGTGNTKLGKRVFTFSLPAVHTCWKGSTETCRSLCYADKGFFTTNSVKERLWKNLALTGRRDFKDVIVNLLADSAGSLLRWHVSGDFYNADYGYRVFQILREIPHVWVWLYSRTWQDLEMFSLLKKIAELNHVQLWFSCDKDTGNPPEVPNRVRLAYMQVADDDIPDYDVDLFFRDGKVRGTVVKRINGTLVCPVENGVTEGLTCDRCRICFTDPVADKTRRTRGRYERRTG
jgi:hypothetical protein